MTSGISRILMATTLILGAAVSQAVAQEDPAALKLPVADAREGNLSDWLDVSNSKWNEVPTAPIHLNRTPPLYYGDPEDDGSSPKTSVRLVRLADDTLVLYAEWGDSTVNQPDEGKKYPDAGEKYVYRLHSGEIDNFPDAFCVMIPKRRGSHPIMPSMMMGGADNPVDLYYWRCGQGMELLDAHGRSSVAKTSSLFQGTAHY